MSTVFIATPNGHPLRFTPALRCGANTSHWPSPCQALRHTSGDSASSAADVQVTQQLREAAKALDIDLLDHVVVGTVGADPVGRGYYSFRESGVL